MDLEESDVKMQTPARYRWRILARTRFALRALLVNQHTGGDRPDNQAKQTKVARLPTYEWRPIEASGNRGRGPSQRLLLYQLAVDSSRGRALLTQASQLACRGIRTPRTKLKFE